MAKQTYNNVKKSHSIVVASSHIADIGKRKVEKGLNKAVSKIQQQNNFETDILASNITTTQKIATTVQVSRSTADQIVKSAPVVAKAVKTGAKGVYNVGKGTLKVAGKGIILAYGIKTGVIRPGHDILERMRRLKESGGLSRKVSAILHAAPKVIFRTAAKGLKTGGVVAGKVIKTGGKTLTKAGFKLGKGGLRQAVRMTDTLLSSGGTFETEVAAATWKTMRYTVKAVVATPKVAKIGYKGAKTAIKGTIKTGRFVVKTGVGTFKAARRGIRVIRRTGFKGALRVYARRWKKSIRNKTIKIFRKAGHSLVNAGIAIIKKFLTKIILPLIVLIAIIAGIETLINCVSGAVTIIFSPFISCKSSSDDEEDEEIDEQKWLTDAIKAQRTALVTDVKTIYNRNKKENGGEYHCVRFFNALQDMEVDLTDANIEKCIYSPDEYMEYIEPIFHTILYSKHELNPTKDEMEKVFKDIWDNVYSIQTEELPTEYCNPDGGCSIDIDQVKDNDGIVHANKDTCPNRSSDQQYHSERDDLCKCDYNKWRCPGHQGERNCPYVNEHIHTDDCYSLNCGREENRNRRNPSLYHVHSDDCKILTCGYDEHTHDPWIDKDNPGCYWTNDHGESDAGPTCEDSIKEFHCDGYYECYGHKVLKISIDTNGLGELLDKYFLKEINELKSKSNLTVDEQAILSEREDEYNVCLSYIDVLAEEYGVGSTTVVDFDKNTLPPNSLVIKACGFIEKPYARGGISPTSGFDSDGFIYYMFDTYRDHVTPPITVTMPRKGSEQVKIGTTISSIAEAKPGDLIFWSTDGSDEGVYHVAFYLGNELILHASNSAPYPQGGVKVSALYGTIYKIQRIIP